jgi:hypothetical protein
MEFGIWVIGLLRFGPQLVGDGIWNLGYWVIRPAYVEAGYWDLNLISNF